MKAVQVWESDSGKMSVTDKYIEALSPIGIRKMGFKLPDATEEELKKIEVPKDVKPPERVYCKCELTRILKVKKEEYKVKSIEFNIASYDPETYFKEVTFTRNEEGIQYNVIGILPLEVELQMYDKVLIDDINKKMIKDGIEYNFLKL